jgi:hypothetical protein
MQSCLPKRICTKIFGSCHSLFKFFFVFLKFGFAFFSQQKIPTIEMVKKKNSLSAFTFMDFVNLFLFCEIPGFRSGPVLRFDNQLKTPFCSPISIISKISGISHKITKKNARKDDLKI